MTSHNTTKQTNYFQYKHLTKPSLFYGVRKRENPYPFFPLHTYVYICNYQLDFTSISSAKIYRNIIVNHQNSNRNQGL